MKKSICLLFTIFLLGSVYSFEGWNQHDATNKKGIDVGDNNITNVGDIAVDTISADAGASGILTLRGTGGTNNENLTFGFEVDANEVNLNSTTGVTKIETYLSIDHRDTVASRFGNSDDVSMWWNTTSNDNFQIGVACGTVTGSGYISIMDKADMGNANRSPAATSADPVFRVYSSDETQVNDYIEMYHDQNHGIFNLGTASARMIFQQGAYSGIQVYADASERILVIGGGNDFRFQGQLDEEQFMFTTSAYYGNQISLNGINGMSKDHDHPVQTNPTLFISSDLNPDTSNNQWGSLHHDQENFVITTGANTGVGTSPTTDENAIVLAPRGTEAGRFDSNATAAETRFMLYDVDNGTMERVTVGSADSGGAGYKLLRIPN